MAENRQWVKHVIAGAVIATLAFALVAGLCAADLYSCTVRLNSGGLTDLQSRECGERHHAPSVPCRTVKTEDWRTCVEQRSRAVAILQNPNSSISISGGGVFHLLEGSRLIVKFHPNATGQQCKTTHTIRISDLGFIDSPRPQPLALQVRGTARINLESLAVGNEISVLDVSKSGNLTLHDGVSITLKESSELWFYRGAVTLQEDSSLLVGPYAGLRLSERRKQAGTPGLTLQKAARLEVIGKAFRPEWWKKEGEKFGFELKGNLTLTPNSSLQVFLNQDKEDYDREIQTFAIVAFSTMTVDGKSRWEIPAFGHVTLGQTGLNMPEIRILKLVGDTAIIIEEQSSSVFLDLKIANLTIDNGVLRFKKKSEVRFQNLELEYGASLTVAEDVKCTVETDVKIPRGESVVLDEQTSYQGISCSKGRE